MLSLSLFCLCIALLCIALAIQQLNRHRFDYLSSSGRKTREFNFWVETEGAAIRLNPAEHSEFKWVDVLSADFVELNLSQETRACVIEAHKEILGNIE